MSGAANPSEGMSRGDSPSLLMGDAAIYRPRSNLLAPRRREKPARAGPTLPGDGGGPGSGAQPSRLCGPGRNFWSWPSRLGSSSHGNKWSVPSSKTPASPTTCTLPLSSARTVRWPPAPQLLGDGTLVWPLGHIVRQGPCSKHSTPRSHCWLWEGARRLPPPGWSLATRRALAWAEELQAGPPGPRLLSGDSLGAVGLHRPGAPRV